MVTTETLAPFHAASEILLTFEIGRDICDDDNCGHVHCAAGLSRLTAPTWMVHWSRRL